MESEDVKSCWCHSEVVVELVETTTEGIYLFFVLCSLFFVLCSLFFEF